MKRSLFSIALIGMVAAALVFSCSKSYNSHGTIVSVQTQTLNQLFAGLRSTPQGLSVTAGRDTIVYGARGTMLHFYANSFKTADGTTITSGIINLQLIEMYKPGDMIANRATTMANGQILQSSGQVKLSASQGGIEVFTNGYGIGFKHSTYSGVPMALFYGATANADSIATWTQSDTSHQANVALGTTIDSAGGGGGGGGISGTEVFFYFDTCSSFTLANCDWFYDNDSPKTSVSVVLPDTSYNPTNTQVFLVLPNINRWGGATDTFTAVMSNDGGYGSTAYNASTNTINILSEGNVSIVPAGLSYKLVAITNKNGQYYYWETSGVVPHSGINVHAVLATDTQSDILARMQGL